MNVKTETCKIKCGLATSDLGDQGLATSDHIISDSIISDSIISDPTNTNYNSQSNKENFMNSIYDFKLVSIILFGIVISLSLYIFRQLQIKNQSSLMKY